MYEVSEIIAAINANIVWFMIFGGIGMIFNWMLFIEAIPLGFKHKTFVMPAFCTLFWSAHDVSFVLLWHTWFVEMDYWVWKLFWVNILLSVVGEVFYYYQMVKYGSDELFPGFSKKQVITFLGLGWLGALAAFWCLKMLMGGDPMFLIMIPLTIFVCPIFNISMALRRGSRRGSSIRLNVYYIILIVGIWGAWYLIHPLFQSPIFIGFGVATILWCIANIFVLKRLPPYQPEKEGNNAALAGVAA